jgi:hypothetical protein
MDTNGKHRYRLQFMAKDNQVLETIIVNEVSRHSHVGNLVPQVRERQPSHGGAGSAERPIPAIRLVAHVVRDPRVKPDPLKKEGPTKDRRDITNKSLLFAPNL